MATDMELAGGNLFMMCVRPDETEFTDIPEGYHIRTCRPDEIELWKTIHFDDEITAGEQKPYMDLYFKTVYEPEGDEFQNRCLFLCGADDVPVGTCFAWRAYGRITTIHWYKIRKDCEDRGLGRALLSYVMRSVAAEDYPVFLHTHPGCFRAIKLYTDFGFSLLTDAGVGYRTNDLEASLPYLRRMMPEAVYGALTFASAPDELLDAARTSEFSHF